MQVYCLIPNQFKGWRNLETFCKEASAGWSKNGKVFPMYDPESKEIFECAFNAERGVIVAYAPVTMSEFREKLEGVAQKLLNDAVFEATQKAVARMADIYAEIEFMELRL